jgi:hypothetical protein
MGSRRRKRELEVSIARMATTSRYASRTQTLRALEHRLDAAEEQIERLELVLTRLVNVLDATVVAEVQADMALAVDSRRWNDRIIAHAETK